MWQQNRPNRYNECTWIWANLMANSFYFCSIARILFPTPQHMTGDVSEIKRGQKKCRRFDFNPIGHFPIDWEINWSRQRNHPRLIFNINRYFVYIERIRFNYTLFIGCHNNNNNKTHTLNMRDINIGTSEMVEILGPFETKRPSNGLYA